MKSPTELIYTGKKAEDLRTAVKAAGILNRGDVGVIPTDTLYGLVGRALDKQAVAKIYRLRKRQSGKPFIILISSVKDLLLFDIQLSPTSAQLLAKLWPGKISVILPCENSDFQYLHRGTQSLAFRLPASHRLRSLIKQTGPLVAPSANIEGYEPALTITQAQAYFGAKIAFYLDAGIIKSEPSTLITIVGNRPKILRPGAVSATELRKIVALV